VVARVDYFQLVEGDFISFGPEVRIQNIKQLFNFYPLLIVVIPELKRIKMFFFELEYLTFYLPSNK